MSGGKGKAPARGKKPKPTESDTKEDVLRAVVLTESFQDRFQPFSVEKPRCLLPLANTPLIEYTLEFLAMNGVQEVYLYGGVHAAQVEEYIDGSRFSPDSSSSPFSSLEFVPLQDATSIGDVLRDLDKRAFVDGDFLVVHGDVVSNIQLDGVFAAHKARREKDKEAVMTMVLREAGSFEAHRTRPTGGITPLFVVDSDTGRCLHYEETHRFHSERRLIMDSDIPRKLSTSFEVRADLIDPGIDICTPEVLALWTETFDYQLPRRDFLNGVLRDWELTGKKIFAEVLDEGYAARAHNLPMYEAVSRDVVGRWTFPLVPDSNIVPEQTYTLEGNVVAEDDVVRRKNATTKQAVIGSKTILGAGSKIINSTVGRGCTIGSNVTITDSAIWDGAVIGDNSTVMRAIVGHDAHIGKGCTIPAGTLVSFNVHVDDGIVFTDPTILSTRNHKNAPAPTNTQLLGPAGKGGRFVDPELEELDPEDPSTLERSLFYSIPKASLSTASMSVFDDSDYDSDESDQDATGPGHARQRQPSFISEDGAGAAGFQLEGVKELLEVLREDEGDLDRARLEFLALRLAHNASEHAVRKAIATALVRRSVELLASLEPSPAAARIVSVKSADKFIREIGIGGTAADAQIGFILALQTAMTRAVEDGVVDASKGGILLAALLQQLYSRDVIDEDGVLAWWEDERSAQGSETMVGLRGKCKVIVEWLQNAEEDSDEEDSEEDDDDE
jgi:translation initiation factor eIF-2B subunit epsilon